MRVEKEGSRRRPSRKASFSIESLEGRALLSQMPPYTSIYPSPARTPPAQPNPVAPDPPNGAPAGAPPTKPAGPTHHVQPSPTGIVTKAPQFYQFYTGPHLAELNAVRASAELSPAGVFTFTGTNQGRIDKAPAVYVWGIDRNGNLPSGSFTNRPNVKFDAVVVVRLSASLAPTATVVDLSSGTSSPLPSRAVTIHGKTISVTVPSSMLPSTGLAPSQYRFNYSPEDGRPPTSSSVASFAPETTTVPVGSSR
ncbi:MAG: hypothetical protein P4L84_36420 [Isosphaeraceae bacterium]|nr:hypothetical protein [Isosphaeraceae bacterium]